MLTNAKTRVNLDAQVSRHKGNYEIGEVRWLGK
jgi:hypothetical protein